MSSCRKQPSNTRTAPLGGLPRPRSRAWATLAGALLFCAVSAILGARAESHLSAGGWTSPGAPSVQAADSLSRNFATGPADLVLLVHDPTGVDSATATSAGLRLSADLAHQPGVLWVHSYWQDGHPLALRDSDGTQALVLAGLGGGDNATQRNLASWLHRFAPRYAGLSVQAGGPAEAARELTAQSRHDLLVAEGISVPVVTLILFMIFRGVLASLLPLMTAGITTIGTLALLRLLTTVTTVSLYASNLTTGLALGLGVDYSLLLVSRYREERAAGFDPDEAVRRSWRTAGRTVAFSAGTVALALTSLFLFPIPLLTSIAFAGIGVVVLAAASSLLVLPAVLRLLGDRFDRRTWARRVVPVEQERWYRIATTVTRRPLRYAIGVMVLLFCLGAPFLDVHFALPGPQVLPRAMDSAQVAGALARDFPARPDTWVFEEVSTIRGRTLDQAALTQYLARLSEVPGTTAIGSTGAFQGGQKVPAPVPAPTVHDGSTWIALLPGTTRGAVPGWLAGLRAVPSPFAVRFTGPAAALADTLGELTAALPYALALVAVSVLVLLWLLTGSILLPVKALVLNGLTLCAMLGVCVVVIQEGHAGPLLGDFTVTGSMSACIPVLMFVLAFGLSMDYEVFLLARIHEEHQRGYRDREAVARGLGRTGRLVTAAALLLALVFAAFITSGVTDLKLLGFGLACAVLLDATLVRGILVPALITLAGRWNWWAPPLLVRLHERVGFSEQGAEATGTPPEPEPVFVPLPAPVPVPERSRTQRQPVRSERRAVLALAVAFLGLAMLLGWSDTSGRSTDVHAPAAVEPGTLPNVSSGGAMRRTPDSGTATSDATRQAGSAVQFSSHKQFGSASTGSTTRSSQKRTVPKAARTATKHPGPTPSP